MATKEFGMAFAQARAKLGNNGVFEYKGKKYNTRTAEEAAELSKPGNSEYAKNQNSALNAELNKYNAQTNIPEVTVRAKRMTTGPSVAQQELVSRVEGRAFEKQMANLPTAEDIDDEDNLARSARRIQGTQDALATTPLRGVQPSVQAPSYKGRIDARNNEGKVINGDMATDQRGRNSDSQIVGRKKKKVLGIFENGGPTPTSPVAQIFANINLQKNKK